MAGNLFPGREEYVESVTVRDRASSHTAGWLAQISLTEEAISIDIFVTN